MSKIVKRSPMFYVGDKFRLMNQLLNLFPKKIKNFYEPFVGGGTVFLNVEAAHYYLNDIDSNVINVHDFLSISSKDQDTFFKNVKKIILKYKLSRSFERDVVPATLKKKFVKTYYAKFNKEGYEKLKLLVNTKNKNDPLILYILLIYGFNRMLRFNGEGKFNLPVGNVDFNRNVVKALGNYFEFVSTREIKFTSKDFRSFFKENSYACGDFVYLDPPYLITASDYNKLWGIREEEDLLALADKLNKNKIKFALSNVTHYNGNNNELLSAWMEKYNIHDIKSNYISYHNNSKKKIREVLITNYR